MAQIGMGAMLHALGGGSEHDADEYCGQKIMSAALDDNKLSLSLSPSGKRIAIWDNGQSCCEERYMTTDDNIQSLVGHELRRIESKPGSDGGDGYDVHETVFVEVGTEVGFITIVNHNVHNGYYGGFGLTITEVE